MHYGEIKNYDIANGIGVRVSLFVSGCTNHCEHCFQPETWDFNYGNDFTEETENRILEMLAPDYICGLTVLGGEPFEPENQRVLVDFLRKVRRKSKNNVRRKLKKMRGLLEAGRITPETVEQSYKSWRGHASKGNCHHLIRNMDQYYNQLFGQAAAVAQKRGGGSASQKEERR